jgi:hypothetical protein
MINKIDTSTETVTKISDDLMMTARVGTDNVRHAQLMDDASNVINALQARAEDAEAKLAKAVEIKVANDVINHWIVAYNNMAAKLAKAVDALRLVRDACDEGKMVSLGTGGMTIDAQIRRSVYNQVPAWPIEEARAVLDELEKPE